MSIDEQILFAFYHTGPHFVTEDQIQKKFGILPDQLKQTLKDLSLLGYSFESNPQFGHRILETPDALIADDLKARLKQLQKIDPIHSPIAHEIIVFENTTSTNNVIENLANNGSKEGLTVIAESQSAGRGRHGRIWISPSRKGLWMSILLRPSFPVSLASQITIMAAVAVTTALRHSTKLPLCIKWPNDVLCEDRKIAGILVELTSDSQKITHAILGIGIDVNLVAEDFPESLRTEATSIRIELGRPFDRAKLCAEILHEIKKSYHQLETHDFNQMLERWITLDRTLGKQVRILFKNEKAIEGLASNLDSDGALLVRTDDGRLERVVAGEVTLKKSF
jgi:BirA family transcriptional regulator, biotin operon repressor / biotin---[acetyl-CoA-carboxylase] ligase